MCMALVEVSKSLPEILNKFALTQNELKIYLHLVKNGPKPANEIGKDLKIYRTETYRLLNSLEKKKMVNMIFAKPTKFLAIGYVDALDVLIGTELNRLTELQLMKDTLSKVNFSKTTSLI
ncbi:MAG: TrmB family transcriptional regulator [Nitrosopumilus sp.]|nr:TrmB family transcriptional regulator [Nitrosopumilus sp.]